MIAAAFEEPTRRLRCDRWTHVRNSCELLPPTVDGVPRNCTVTPGIVIERGRRIIDKTVRAARISPLYARIRPPRGAHTRWISCMRASLPTTTGGSGGFIKLLVASRVVNAMRCATATLTESGGTICVVALFMKFAHATCDL